MLVKYLGMHVRVYALRLPRINSCKRSSRWKSRPRHSASERLIILQDVGLQQGFRVQGFRVEPNIGALSNRNKVLGYDGELYGMTSAILDASI